MAGKYDTPTRHRTAWVLTAALLGVISTTPAETIPRNGPFCPSGYLAVGDYCRLYSSDQPGGVLPRRGAFCPSGYLFSGDYCVPWSRDVRPQMVPKRGARCPSGYISDASGRYCRQE